MLVYVLVTAVEVKEAEDGVNWELGLTFLCNIMQQINRLRSTSEWLAVTHSLP
jgi:hypothetical protein